MLPLMMLPKPCLRMGAACFMPSITLRTRVAIAASTFDVEALDAAGLRRAAGIVEPDNRSGPLLDRARSALHLFLDRDVGLPNTQLRRAPAPRLPAHDPAITIHRAPSAQLTSAAQRCRWSPVITATLPSSRPMPVAKPTFDRCDIPQPLPATQGGTGQRLARSAVAEGHNCGFRSQRLILVRLCGELERRMAKWIDEFRAVGGAIQPSMPLRPVSPCSVSFWPRPPAGLAQIQTGRVLHAVFPGGILRDRVGGFGWIAPHWRAAARRHHNFSSGHADPAALRC